MIENPQSGKYTLRPDRHEFGHGDRPRRGLDPIDIDDGHQAVALRRFGNPLMLAINDSWKPACVYVASRVENPMPEYPRDHKWMARLNRFESIAVHP
jgi:hypothetical protein